MHDNGSYAIASTTFERALFCVNTIPTVLNENARFREKYTVLLGRLVVSPEGGQW